MAITYTTWNPEDKAAGITLSNGNLTAISSAGYSSVRSVLGVNEGKYYWEITVDVAIGQWQAIATSAASLNTDPGSDANIHGYYKANGHKTCTGTSVSYGDSYAAGAVIGIALDMDNGKVWFSKNGVWQASGDPANGTNPACDSLSGTYYAMWPGWSNDQATANFGASAFSYSVPSGFNSGVYSEEVEAGISYNVSILSEFEFDANFGHLNEDANVNSEFACLVADSPISENVSVNSDIIYFESDSPISENTSVSSDIICLVSDSPVSEDVSINTAFVCEYTGELSENASVNSAIAVIHQQSGELSEEASVNSEFKCYQRPANIDAELPMITADILGGQGGFLDTTLPLITADIKSGAILEASLPAITASLEGKVGAVGNIDAVLPSLIADIEGKVETLGEIEALLPVLRASLSGKTGDLATCAAILPMLSADVQGYHTLTGDVDATLPLIEPYMVGTIERAACEVLRYSR